MQEKSSIILFDGICNLCNSSVTYILRFDKRKKFRFASMQSDAGQKLISNFETVTELPESILLIEKQKVYSESTAALKIAKQLQFPISLLYAFILIPKFLRDPVYRWVARNRYRWFGKKESCMLPTEEMKERFL